MCHCADCCLWHVQSMLLLKYSISRKTIKGLINDLRLYIKEKALIIEKRAIVSSCTQSISKYIFHCITITNSNTFILAYLDYKINRNDTLSTQSCQYSQA